MAEQWIVYGYIIAAPSYQNTEVARARNVQTLADLPDEDDDWPPLTRRMFGITGPRVLDGSYAGDMIHFGATLKSLDDSGPQWLWKFVELLRHLYWYEAKVHVYGIWGGLEFDWRATAGGMTGTDPTPTTAWEFDDHGNWPWPSWERNRLLAEERPSP